MARIELVDHLWWSLQKHILSEIGRISPAAVATDLEKRVVSWVMELRPKFNFHCLRLADVPEIGMSGTKHKVDDVILYSGRTVNSGFIVECKGFEPAGAATVLGPRVIATLISSALDLCPKVFFARRFYQRTDNNYCTLISMKPLKESAIRYALSLGVIVIQPMVRVLSRRGLIDRARARWIPECLPPEVLWKELRTSPKTSVYNIRIARSLCKHTISQTLEQIYATDCALNFSLRSRNSNEIFNKTSYLTDYLMKSCEDRLP